MHTDTDPVTTTTYSSMQVVEMTGCSYRQLDHWCRIGLVPGQTDWLGQGRRRRFTPEQVERVQRIKRASMARNATLADRVAS